MYKIKDNVDLKELEKFGYIYWDIEDAQIIYLKHIEINRIIIEIYKDRTIDFELPINGFLTKSDIKLETFIEDIIQAGLVEKVGD